MCDNIRIIEKIQKLMELSKNKAATEAEALSALSMAQKLMATYSIEYSDIGNTVRDESDVISIRCEHKWDAGYRKPLASVMAENYKCKCYVQGSSVMFMGVKEDAYIAKTAFEFAYKFIMRRGNQEYERLKSAGYSGKGVFNSYAYGFISGLKEILEAQSKALMIVVPETVITAFNNLSLGKGRGGMRTGDGVYKDVAERGRKDAKDHYGSRAITAGGNN